LVAGAIDYDAAVAHQDHSFYLWGDVAEVVGDEDEAGALLYEGAHGFAEVALGGEVEGVARFVEEELAGAVDEGAGDEDAASFSGGHFADFLLGEVGGVDAFEGFGGSEAHFVGNDEVGPEGGCGEESGDDGVEADGAADRGAGGVEACGDGCHAGHFADDAEVFAELGEVPAGAAEDLDFHAGKDEGVDFAIHGANEGGFPAAIGAENGYVLACLDVEVDIVEDDAVSEGDVDIGHAEELFRVGGVGSHLI